MDLLLQLHSFDHETCKLILEIMNFIFELNGETSKLLQVLFLADPLHQHWMTLAFDSRCKFNINNY